MKIKKVVIKNYKSIKNLEIDSIENLNVFIGKNDAGKSNVINALDVVFNSQIQNYDGSLKLVSETELDTVFEGLAPYTFFDKNKPEAELTVYLEVNQRELGKNGFNLEGDVSELVISKKIASVNNRTKILFNFVRLDKSILIKTPDEKKRFLTRDGSYSDKLSDCVAKNILEELGNEFILVPADRNIVRDPHPSSEKMQVEEYIKDSLIRLANSNDEDKNKLFKQFSAFIEKISPLIDRVEPLKEKNSIVNLRFLTSTGEDIKLSTIGGGNNELLLLLHEIIISGGKMLAIEEPEIHLHPEAERKLFKFMEEFSQTTQIFVVTHSPVFVEPYTLRGLFRVEKKGHETQMFYMNEKDYIDNDRLEQELNTENCEMFFSDKVLLVEGISDKIFMEGLIAKYCKSTAEIKVISSYSKDNFDIYLTLLKIFKIPYVVMTDLDALKGRFQIKIIWHELKKHKDIRDRYERIEFLKTKHIHVLSKGDLERSYPRQYRRGVSKPLDALNAIHNLTEEDYNSDRMKDIKGVIDALEK
ncbi:AAA family ATPase [Candidatus Woesearchaeota archaeon]|nr:AAA family ATPase [Candidatus Woesearchaeota archaeon]